MSFHLPAISLVGVPYIGVKLTIVARLNMAVSVYYPSRDHCVPMYSNKIFFFFSDVDVLLLIRTSTSGIT